MPTGRTQEPVTSTVLRRLAAGTTLAAVVVACATLSGTPSTEPATRPAAQPAAAPAAVPATAPVQADGFGDPVVDRHVSDRAARTARTRQRQRPDSRAETTTPPPQTVASTSTKPAKKPAAAKRPRRAAAVPVAGPVDGSRVNIVTAYARAQVGKRYVRRGTGPNSFDCSGLTLAAYAQVGVTLPHFTGAQVTRGRAVGRAELQPGDLVFPHPGHVGVYVGGGQMVHASTPRGGVKLSAVYDFWTARRIL